MQPFAALLLAALAAPGGDFGVAPRSASWEELTSEVFDPRWIVPRASPEELRRSGAGVRDLVADLKRLARLRFEPSEGSTRLERARSLGDLLVPFVERRAQPDLIDAMLEELERARPDVWAEVGWALPELVRQSWFLSDDWDPDKDRRDDGFLVVEPRDLALSGVAPFTEARGSRALVQVATLMQADLVAAKAAENDFRTWPSRKRASYERIRPIERTYLRASDPQGRPVAALRIEFRCDIPFPFSHYDCDLRMLHRLDEDGHLVSDVESKSDDFYWLAGQDVYIPVYDSQGAWVSMLCVRVFGTDLRGVPDGVDNLEAGCRQGVGSVKRDAERLWRERGAREPVLEGQVPEFAVRGRR